ncbi:MAG: GAF domain-containing sensor histidine kinase [Deinococcaceae bacterium]
MKPVPKPTQETERLAALHRYAILDTPPEEAFDRITRLAANVLSMPLAAIHFIDRDRQWSKSAQGIPACISIDRDQSFCAHTILHEDMMIIPDAKLDERFRDNPIVLHAPHVRFYASQPLQTPDGYVIGTLCVADTQVRMWDTRESQILKSLSQIVVSELELYSKRRELEKRLFDVEQVSQQKSDFVADISHELRTPLTSILGFSQLMLAGLGGPLSEQGQEYIFIVYDSGEQMLSLVNNLLDMEKIEAGHLELAKELVDPSTLIRKVKQMIQLRADHKSISLNTESAPCSEILADRSKLLQVILNLVSNALKFTPEGGSITLRTVQIERRLCIEVEDTGVGMDEFALKQLFSRFSQVDPSLSRRHAGTGLGLFLAKRLIEMHGGTISVESALGKGTLFRMELPLASSL